MDTRSLSEPHAVAIDGIDDAVRRFTDHTSGTWAFGTYLFVPETMDDLQHLILLNTYPADLLSDWSLQLEIDGANDRLSDRDSNASLPLVKGAWSWILVEIGLDADRQTVYYDGVELLSKSWTAGVQEGGASNIAAVDLWGTESAHEVYYDHMSLREIETPCREDLDGSGAVDFGDVLPILAAWGQGGGPEDLDGSGTVDFGDVLAVLARWGPCP